MQLLFLCVVFSTSTNDAVLKSLAEKSAEKSSEKTAEKSSEKTAEKSSEKTAEKSSKKSVEKTAEKSTEKTGDGDLNGSNNSEDYEIVSQSLLSKSKASDLKAR